MRIKGIASTPEDVLVAKSSTPASEVRTSDTVVRRLKPWDPELEVQEYIAGNGVAVATLLKVLAVLGWTLALIIANPRSVLEEQCPSVFPIYTGHSVVLTQGILTLHDAMQNADGGEAFQRIVEQAIHVPAPVGDTTE